MARRPRTTSPAANPVRANPVRANPVRANPVLAILRTETVGGALLLAATVLALAWANSPFAGVYFALRELKLGYAPWHLELSLGTWAADGLLAVFFFLAGLELKREFVAGELRNPAKAIVPVAAAAGGVALPALIYVFVNLGAGIPGTGAQTLQGWAIPTATDIAFALAVLAVISTHLPAALRVFLLTLAVVDDLIAIGIIAFFYSHGLEPVMLLAAVVPLGLFTLLVRKQVRSWYLLLPLAAATWAFVHASGIHATVAGVLLGFAVPVSLGQSFEHRIRPFSAGFAVPVFAFFSAGVSFGGVPGLGAALADPVAIGIVLALVAGKAVGVFGTTFLVAKTTRARLDDGLAWVDVAGLSLLAGVGFTVSLLIAELGFGTGSPQDDHAKVAILTGSLIAALLAAVVLKSRNRHYRRVAHGENGDDDGGGIGGVFRAEITTSEGE